MTLARYSWTQPCCGECLHGVHLVKHLNAGWHRLANPDPEVCCYCGAQTGDGWFVRVDPETVPHPTAVKD